MRLIFLTTLCTQVLTQYQQFWIGYACVKGTLVLKMADLEALNAITELIKIVSFVLESSITAF